MSNSKSNHIGKPFVTDSKPTYLKNILEKHCRENMDFKGYTNQIGDGCVYYGQAGCGKTTTLVKLALEGKDPVITFVH